MDLSDLDRPVADFPRNRGHFLSHYVFSGDALEEWAGAGPLVVDDHTRLDFTVPRSKDSSYGIANYNTNLWLVQLMEPGAKHNVAFATFGRKVRRLASYKQPVLPHLRGVRASGLDPAEVARRIDEAHTKLPIH